MTTLTLPGVGGSEPAHWQSWLETQLDDSQRIEQVEWNKKVQHCSVAYYCVHRLAYRFASLPVGLILGLITMLRNGGQPVGVQS